MPKRTVTFAAGERYHVFNRGMLKNPIFRNNRDRLRFIYLMLTFQGSVTHGGNISRLLEDVKDIESLEIDRELRKLITHSRQVALEAFALMPNHFHFLLQEKIDGGISRYMQRLQNAYTKYVNTKYESFGHLFQGPFQAVHVESNPQLLHLSAYIHKNPTELPNWRRTAHGFPWSSYQDYAIKNRWGTLLETTSVLRQFKNAQDYRKYVENSSAKAE